jgi:hypothetical protein
MKYLASILSILVFTIIITFLLSSCKKSDQNNSKECSPIPGNWHFTLRDQIGNYTSQDNVDIDNNGYFSITMCFGYVNPPIYSASGNIIIDGLSRTYQIKLSGVTVGTMTGSIKNNNGSYGGEGTFTIGKEHCGIWVAYCNSCFNF